MSETYSRDELSFMSGKRRSFLLFASILIAAVAMAFSWTASAGADEVHNWGYGNLTKSNPAPGTCNAGYPFNLAGACLGYRNWDYSRVYWNSGTGAFDFGFICSPAERRAGTDGYGRGLGDNSAFGTYTLQWNSSICGHYLRVFVRSLEDDGVAGTYNYLKSTGLIF
jgi:hypothetical protein